jgi:hypothetical protein
MSEQQPKGARGGAYIRTSKDAQDQRSQVKKVEDWLKARAIVPETVQWIIDSGSRDLSHKRAGYQQMMHLVQEGRIDWFVVSERDRLGFQDAWEYGHIVYLFRNHGVELWCVSEDKELTGSGPEGGDRIEPFLATLAADKSRQEQADNSDRAHRSKRSTVERGEWPGGQAPWGYDLVARDAAGQLLWRLVYEPGRHRRVCRYPDGTSRRFDGRHNTPRRNRGETLTPEPSRDTTLIGWVRQVFTWYAEGWAAHAIAAQLNDKHVPALCGKLWLGPTIQKILENPIYATGRPTWNKKAHGRFLEYKDGKYVQVERVNGKSKMSRKRNPSDHIQAPVKPEHALISLDLWNTVQARTQEMRAEPKTRRRPRNPNLWLSGLVVCGDCNQCMVGWGQQEAYRCTTNMRYNKGCRCNKAKHDILEEVVLEYLEQTQQTLGFLYDNPDHCQEVLQLEEQSQPLISEYTHRLGQLWQQAKAAGAQPQGDLRVWTHASLQALQQATVKQGARAREAAQAEATQQAVRAKEEEQARLARRLGLLEDEDAAQAVAVRLKGVAQELRELRGKVAGCSSHQQDRLDTLRARLQGLLEQTALAREVMAESLPRRKGEYLRKLVKQIRVIHQERKMGKLRASRLVGVEIIPTVSGEDRPAPV